MRNLRLKRVMRLDTIQRHYRLFRVMWERGRVGDGRGYSVKLAFGLWPKLCVIRREVNGVLVGILGLRVHYSRSYGGIYG